MKLTRIFDGRVKNCRACFWLLSAVLACAASASRQSGQRVVETTFPLDQPLEMVGVEVAGGMHAFTKGGTETDAVAAFDAPDDWLRHLVFKFRNKTDKTILSAALYGSLAVGEDGEVPMGFDLLFGQELDESAFTGRPPQGVPNSLAPGQTGEVSWSEAEYAQLENSSRRSTRSPATAR